MTFREIVEKYQALKIYEERHRGQDYEELVFYKNEQAEWSRVFEDALGPAVKPEGAKPSLEDLRITKDHGGITPRQTLYRREIEDGTLLAMFWPWQDNLHCTLKVVFLRASSPADGPEA